MRALPRAPGGRHEDDARRSGDGGRSRRGAPHRRHDSRSLPGPWHRGRGDPSAPRDEPPPPVRRSPGRDRPTSPTAIRTSPYPSPSAATERSFSGSCTIRSVPRPSWRRGAKALGSTIRGSASPAPNASRRHSSRPVFPTIGEIELPSTRPACSGHWKALGASGAAARRRSTSPTWPAGAWDGFWEWDLRPVGHGRGATAHRRSRRASDRRLG